MQNDMEEAKNIRDLKLIAHLKPEAQVRRDCHASDLVSEGLKVKVGSQRVGHDLRATKLFPKSFLYHLLTPILFTKRHVIKYGHRLLTKDSGSPTHSKQLLSRCRHQAKDHIS